MEDYGPKLTSMLLPVLYKGYQRNQESSEHISKYEFY